jgi:HNH endonuclease
VSYKLQIGEMKVSYLTDKEIWSHFNYIFSAKSKNSTTYKFVLVKSLLENLYNVNEDLELNYSQVFSSFARIYWNLVVQHDLNQINMMNRRAEVQNILLKTTEKYNLPKGFIFDKLTDELQIEVIHNVMKKCKLNVMGAIFGDTNGTIYNFDNKREVMRINPSYHSFMQRHQRMLLYMANYHLALFLEKFNEQGDTTHILMKVENVSKRSSLDPFYQILQANYESYCFYCGKKVTKDNTHVDHFIPWSFVQADQLWNLVLSCAPCNLSKNDKLANVVFLEDLVLRNEDMLKNKRLISSNVYKEAKLKQLYNFSIDNGYTDIWMPKKSRLVI